MANNFYNKQDIDMKNIYYTIFLFLIITQSQAFASMEVDDGRIFLQLITDNVVKNKTINYSYGFLNSNERCTNYDGSYWTIELLRNNIAVANLPIASCGSIIGGANMNWKVPESIEGGKNYELLFTYDHRPNNQYEKSYHYVRTGSFFIYTKPALVFPSDHSVDQPVEITFDWKDITASDEYWFLIGEQMPGYNCSSNTSTNTIYEKKNLQDSYHTIPDKILSPDTKYYWQIVSKQSGKCFNTSADFTTKAEKNCDHLIAPSLGNDLTMFTDEIKTIDAGIGYSSYLWSNGKKNQTIQIDGESIGAGTYEYSVIVSDDTECTKSSSVKIKVLEIQTCQPDWQPVVYVNSTVAYGIVTINEKQASENDIVGVFVNGECRGKSGKLVIDGNKTYVTLNIQGTAIENATFKIWNTEKCAVYQTNLTVQTNPGGDIGAYPDVLIIDGNHSPDDTSCPQWDFVKNNNQIIDYLDLGAFADHWLQTQDHENWDKEFNLSPVPDPETGKQIINYMDLGVFADHWLESSPCSE